MAKSGKKKTAPKAFLEAAKKSGFQKGDPRINRNGRPKIMPLQKELMKQLLGHTADEDMTESEIALVVKALIETAKDKRSPAHTTAAKELLERAFGKVKPGEDIDEEKPKQITGFIIEEK